MSSQKPRRLVMSTPQVKAAWAGCREVYSKPSRCISFLPGGYLSRHRSVPDLGAVGRVGRRSCDNGPAGLWYLRARPASGHCHYRDPHWRLARSSLMVTPNPSPWVRGHDATLPTRASAGSRWVWPWRVLQNQGPEVNGKGLLPRHHPGHSPGSSPGLPQSWVYPALTWSIMSTFPWGSWRTWSPPRKTTKVRRLGVGACECVGRGECWLGLDWKFSGKLREDFCPWKGTWKGKHVGNLFSHSSSTSPRIKTGSTSKTYLFRGIRCRCRTQGQT